MNFFSHAKRARRAGIGLVAMIDSEQSSKNIARSTFVEFVAIASGDASTKCGICLI